MRLFQIRGPRRSSGDESDGTLRVFITGATGYIGRAVVREFVEAGHEVAGLTRWAEKTFDVKELGARAVVGELRDSRSYRRVAAEYDVLIHLAAERSDTKVLADQGAVTTLLWAADQNEDRRKDDPPRSVIYTSGCFVLGDTGEDPADESAPTDHPPESVAWRPEQERRVLEADSEAVATSVVRPGMVYGGGGGLISEFFDSSEREGAAAYIGDGKNRWSPVYRGDVARLYRMIAEQRARGIFHCTEGAGVPVAELARAASEAAGADGKTRGIPLDEARAARGGLADALVMDQVLVSPRAEALGWTHEHAPFVESAPDLYREWKEARQ